MDIKLLEDFVCLAKLQKLEAANGLKNTDLAGGLTRRELAVLQMIAPGKSNKSFSSAKNYRLSAHLWVS